MEKYFHVMLFKWASL